jgi:hypothetical protein
MAVPHCQPLFRVLETAAGISGLEFGVWGLEFGVPKPVGVWVAGFGYRVWRLRVGVWGLRSGVGVGGWGLGGLGGLGVVGCVGWGVRGRGVWG